ncbi:hypothetical protein NZK33_09755 [Cyanobium sp. FGCU-6]|jgi:hypothetical protein|nr:hypothetical protein [Cyanobium sp. FGCU6]
MNRRLSLTLGTLAVGVLAGLTAATALGGLLAPFSIDQPIRPVDLLGWGCRWGALLGALAAAGAVAGPRRPASPERVLLVVALALALLVGLALLGGAGMVAGQRLGLVGRHWQLPSRSGHALRLGVTTAAEVLGLPLALTAAAVLHGARPPVPLGRQGGGCAKLR